MVQTSFLIPAVAGLAAIRTAHGATTTVINAVDLAFEPTSVTASPGDVLEFHFQQFNHSVAMGDFSSPCMPATSGGFFSGFWPVMAGENVRHHSVLLVSLRGLS
jgi:plastocyanin